jgi:hypothetical protein
MKLIAYILMTVALVLGTVAATTAYSPALDLPDERLLGLTLNADAGVALTEAFGAAMDGAGGDRDALVRGIVAERRTGERLRLAEAAAPAFPAWQEDLKEDEKAKRAWGALATQDAEITPELLAAMRAMGVDRVRVKEFAFGRWEHAWLMGLACLGLVVAAVMLKVQRRAEIAAKLAASDEGGTESPEYAISEIRGVVESVLAMLPTLGGDAERMELILDRVGGLQWTHVQAILDARTTLIGRLKLAGYAQFMDRFSALERQLNRAWSAAADGVLEESVASLEGARELLPQVEERLRS